MKNRIIIFDTTLRDGEQSPGASLTVREKLRIGRQLVKLGVDVIEAGFPIASEGDFEAVSAVARALKGVSVAGLARCLKKDIETAARALEKLEPVRKRLLDDELKKAGEHFAKENLEKAAPHYQRALLLDPGNIRAKEGLQMYRRLKELKNKQK